MKNSRDQILEKLRTSASERSSFEIESEKDNGFDKPESLIRSFIEKLESVGGKGFTVNNSNEFAEMILDFSAKRKWNKIYCSDSELCHVLKNSGVILQKEEPTQGNYDVAVAKCESLIGLTGSVLVSSNSSSGRKIHVAPDIHVVYAGISQLKPFIKDGFDAIKETPSWIGLITGPSRTADIEKTLVMGAHGPKELLVFIDESC